MRPWRKLHSSVLESERFMDVPLEAKVLFFLLVAAQDDAGYYPWERMKVRHLVATCGWSETQARKYADMLVTGGMASWEEGGIVLRNGAELNGRPRDDRKSFLHQRSTTDIPMTVNDRQRYVLETEEIKETEIDKIPPLSPSKGESNSKVITPDFIEEMVTVFQDQLGGETRCRETIAEAMNHKAMDKRKDKRLYLKGWLRRDAEQWKEQRDGNAGVSGLANARKLQGQRDFSDPGRYAKEADRLRRGDALPS